MEGVGALDKRWFLVDKKHSNMGAWHVLPGKYMPEGDTGAMGQEEM